MKKITLIFISLLCSSICYAQFGVKGGLNLANLGADAENNSNRLGINLGVFYQTQVTDKIMFKPEIQYSTQGSNADDSNFGFDQSVNYMNTIFTGSYLVSDNISLDVSPYLGFLLSAEAQADAGDFDNKDLFKSIDFGVGLGATYSVSSSINLNLRYLFGIADITDDQGGTETVVIDGFPVQVEIEEQKITNQVLQFSVGYVFN